MTSAPPASTMLPFRFDLGTRHFVFEDVGTCRFTAATYDWALEDWHAAGNPGKTWTCDDSTWQTLDFRSRALPLKLFIFHMSRCGSTLLARVLAQSSRIHVISEASVFNDYLFSLSNDQIALPILAETAVPNLQRLIQAMAHDRGLGQEGCAIKFTSWNILQLPLLTRAFPNTPCLFLYRRPEEVMVSCLQRPTAFPLEDQTQFDAQIAGVSLRRLQNLSPAEYVALCIRRLMICALASPRMHFLNYANLKPENLATLIHRLGLPIPEMDLEPMQAAFENDAKRDRPFVDDGEAKQQATTPEIREAVERLLEYCYLRKEQSPRNLYPNLVGPTHAR